MDHQTFDMQKFGGISRYFANIHNDLQLDPDFSDEISVLKTGNFYLRNEVFSKNPLIHFLLKRQKKQNKYNRKYSVRKINEGKFDLFHPTYYDPYFLEHLSKPFVLTVHDMIHEVYPEFFAPYDEFTKFKRLTIAKADHIIAISEKTKADLQNYLEIPDEKITVVYHGVDIAKKNKLPALPGLISPYVLYIGDRAGYKNFYRLLSAFKNVNLAHPEVKLVCTGGAFNPNETEFLIRNKLTDKVIQISASDDELNALYQHAICYISPSLLEGFGFPILEAFSNDCLTLLSDTECFHEIAGNGAVYFNPLNVDNIAECILSAIMGFPGKDEKILQANLQLQKFPLEKSMKETKAVYQKMLGR